MDEPKTCDIQVIEEPNGDETVIVTPKDGRALVNEDGEAILFSKSRTVEELPPIFGSRVVSHNRVMTVGKVRYDASGNRWILDADTGIWEQA